MAKRLVIMRHAKSTWDYLSISDMDRPLKEVGINNTLTICNELKKRNIKPDLIITSHAIRALHTALIVARELNYPPVKINLDPNLYHDSEEDIINIIKCCDNTIETLFIFGHNPTFTLIANYFLDKKIENLPTSGTAIFEFTGNKWSEISFRTKSDEMCLFPKSLDND